MIRKYLHLTMPVLAVLLAMFAALHVIKAQQQPELLTPPVQPARTPFGQTVAGAGIVEPSSENISIGTALPGVILEVYVPVDKVGTLVQEGYKLFQVDDRALQAQLKYQEATLLAAEAQLQKLEAMPRKEELPPSDAKVRVAEANVALQEDLASRAVRLGPSGAMAQEDIRQRQLTLAMTRQQLLQAKADYALLEAGAWEPDKAIARATVAQTRAAIAQTRTDIERCVVRAPIDGEILQVNVRKGEYVGTPPSQALMVIGNSHKMHVRVDVDEHDIPRFRSETPAWASLRGNPEVKYSLKFVRVEPYVVPKKSLTGDNTERVDTRVLQVIYALDTTDKALVYVGQQMDVFIETHK